MTNLVGFPGGANQTFRLVEPDWSAVYTDTIDQEIASKTWRAAEVDMRDAGTISHAQDSQLRRYVFFVVQFEAAQRSLDAGGVIQRAKKTGVPMTNPLWTIAHQADARALAIEAELGLNPRRRAAATAAKRKKSGGGAADSYLGGKKA